MKHIKFEENILLDDSYQQNDRNADDKKTKGIAKHFAETLEYDEKKKWFHQVPEEPSVTKTLNDDNIVELKKEAARALHGDTLAYETKSNRSGSSDQQWARTLMSKGAIGDKVAAATILIQDNPIHNLPALRNLVNSVKPAKKKDGIVVIDALSELLISELLIPDLKLRKFEDRPLGHLDEMCSGNKQMKKNILKLWYYEDQLKELYGNYVDALNKFAHDSVDANKEKAVSAMANLLVHHPERESLILSHIINKLGDPSQSVASKVIYHLCQLLYNHPNMKAVVLGDIEKMLFRTNISSRAQYYGVCFLNQFHLHKDDSLIAEKLIKIYFSFFKASIKTGEIDSRLMSAILTGVKRAYPFANKDRLHETNSHVDAIHKLVHLGKFNVAIQALSLLYHIADSNKHAHDRYYTALYRKLTNPDIFNTTYSALFFSLIYKSLKNDKVISRVAAFVKRLLQLATKMTPSQASGVLLLISQVVRDKSKSGVIKLTWPKTEVKDEEQENIPKEEEDKNLTENENLLETENSQEISKNVEETEIKNEESKKNDLLKGNKMDLLNDDSDEETYQDLKIDQEGNIKPKKRVKSKNSTGWFHVRVKNELESTEIIDNSNRLLETKIALKKTINSDRVITTYDPHARNPTFAGAQNTAFVELILLANHFHPTVKLFAEKLLKGEIIQYPGDPLKDFSGVRFLDRFVFKNPKNIKKVVENEGELKKVKGSHPKFAVRKNYTAKGIRGVAVNSSNYLNEDIKKIPVEERFLYDFLQRRRTHEDKDEDSDNESVNSEDFNTYLDSMTGTAKDVDSEDEIDFLTEVKNSIKKKQGKKKSSAEESENEASEGDDGSEDDLEISGDEDIPQLSGDENELELEGSDEDDFIENPKDTSSKKKSSLKGDKSLGSLFASAEEFSTLLEETGQTDKQGSSQAISNTDNSNRKQLAWEEKRHNWIKGYNRNLHGGKNKKFSKKNDVSAKKFGNAFNKNVNSFNKNVNSSNKNVNSANKNATSAKKFGNASKNFVGKRKGSNINIGGKKKKY